MRIPVLFAFGMIMAASAAAQAQVTAPVTPAPQGLKPSAVKPPVVTTPAPPAATAAPAPAVQSGAAAAPEAPRHHRHHRGLKAMFERANVTHDGKLTPEQAQASWPSVARHFAEIDKDNRGYITMQQIHDWRRAHRHHRRHSTSHKVPATAQ